MKNDTLNSKSQGCKPDITYPCNWQYKIIGEDREAIVNVVSHTLGPREYILTDSNTSSGGRYRSLSLELVVGSEEERLALYSHLAGNPAVKIVL